MGLTAMRPAQSCDGTQAPDDDDELDLICTGRHDNP